MTNFFYLPEMLNFSTNTSFSTSSHEGYRTGHLNIRWDLLEQYDETAWGQLTLKRVRTEEFSYGSSYSFRDHYSGTFSGSGGFKQLAFYDTFPWWNEDFETSWTHSYHMSFTITWGLGDKGISATTSSLGNLNWDEPFTASRDYIANLHNTLEEYDDWTSEFYYDWTNNWDNRWYNFYTFDIARTTYGGWKLLVDHDDLAYGVLYSFDIVNDSIAIPDGGIEARLVNLLPTDVDDGIDEAVVTLYRQDGFVRDELNGETSQEYNEFLRTRERTQIGSPRHVTKKSNSRVSFDSITLFDRAIGAGPGAYRPTYYTIEVTNAETDETDPNRDPVDPAFTVKTIFPSSTLRNVRPTPQSTEFPIPETIVELTPADVFISKLYIIEALALASPNNYYSIEIDDALPWVTALKNGTTTDAQIEALKRMLWAERVVRDGYIFADQAAGLMLGGLATLFADAFDDLTDYSRNDIKTGRKQLDDLREGKLVPTTFYDKSEMPIENYFPNLDTYKVIRKGEKAGMAKDMLKTMKVLIGNAAVEAGLDNETAALVAKVFHTSAQAILSGVMSQTRKGMAKPVIKQVISYAIEETKPYVMDGTLLGSYCGNTKDDLQFAVDTAQSWNSVDPDLYISDRNEVVGTLREMGNDASTVIATSQILMGLGEGLDASQDAFALFGNALKQLKVAEKIAQIGKYLSNAGSVVGPTVLLVHTLPESVRTGTHQAYGLSPAQSMANLSAIPATEIYIRNGPSYTALYNDTASLKTTLTSLQNNLKSDMIKEVILQAADDSDPNSYVSILSSLSQNLSLFKIQINALQPNGSSSNLGSALGDLILRDSEYKASQIRFILRLREFLMAVDLAQYSGIDDPAYQQERNALVSQIAKEIVTINNFRGAIFSSDIAANNQPMAPVAGLEILSVVSESTGLSTISESEEIFSLEAQVTNLSSSPMNNLTALLTVDSASSSIAMVSGDELPVGGGSLNAGGSATVIWRFSYNGDLANEHIRLELNMLENGVEPVSFDFNQPESQLIVDPAISDRDSDFLPDDWEALHGLSVDVDSSNGDPDGDELTNAIEYELRTNPRLADTDGDNLNDLEEITGGMDGFQTDPLQRDTDGDGANDDVDGQPLDSSTTSAGDTMGDGEVSISRDTIVLSSSNRLEHIQISNTGSGPLSLTAVAEDDAILLVSPTSPNVKGGEGELSILVQPYFDFSQDGIIETTVSVLDVAGATNDMKTITVLVAGDNTPVWTGHLIEDELGDIDTGDWFGWINVSLAPWLYSYSNQGWIYCPEENVYPNGSWIYVQNLTLQAPDLLLVMVPGTNWGWSFGLSKWMYVTETSIQAGNGWVYAL